MSIAALLFVCVALSFVFRRSPEHLLCIAIIIVFVVPYIAGSQIVTGLGSGEIGLHPATILILFLFASQLIAVNRWVVGEIIRNAQLYALLALVTLGVLLTCVLSSRGVILAVNQVLAPILVFTMVRAICFVKPGFVMRLRNVLIALAVLESVLGILQWITGTALFFESAYSRYTWFDLQSFPRVMGTLEHPLTLSLFLSVMVPFLSTIRNEFAKFTLLLTLIAGVALTQSRFGIIFVGVATVSVILSSSLNRLLRVLLTGISALVLVYMSSAAGLFGGAISRFSEDRGGSADSRFDSAAVVLDNLGKFLISGDGFGSSFRFSASSGLETSLESSGLMYIVDLGLFISLVYFAIQWFLVCRFIAANVVSSLALAV